MYALSSCTRPPDRSRIPVQSVLRTPCIRYLSIESYGYLHAGNASLSRDREDREPPTDHGEAGTGCKSDTEFRVQHSLDPGMYVPLVYPHPRSWARREYTVICTAFAYEECK
jgi:hypothetical protein